MTIRFEDLKRHETPVGFVQVLMDEGKPLATHRLFLDKETATAHAQHTSPSRLPCIVALRGEHDTATVVVVFKKGQKFEYKGEVWETAGPNSDHCLVAVKGTTSLEFPICRLSEAIMTGDIRPIQG